MSVLHVPVSPEDLGISAAQWAALNPESQRMLHVACLSKGAWFERKEAYQEAGRLTRRDSTRVTRAYRCPFVLTATGHHFHVGRAPDLATIEATARTIRDLHGTRPPTWVDGKNPKAVGSCP